MKNLAGVSDIDDDLAIELELAGIDVHRFGFLHDKHVEVKTKVIGILHGWAFHRNWYYWVASGPGITLNYATPLHEKHGQVVRVEGHCGCPSPLEWGKGFAIGSYHVDTQEGLNALAATIKQIAADAALVLEAETK